TKQEFCHEPHQMTRKQLRGRDQLVPLIGSCVRAQTVGCSNRSHLLMSAAAGNVTRSMKVEVERNPESVSTLRIELPPEEVTKEWDAIATSFARFAKIPGYRPGKAPRRVIEAKFRKE